jgi:hypothetical protein
MKKNATESGRVPFQAVTLQSLKERFFHESNGIHLMEDTRPPGGDGLHGRKRRQTGCTGSAYVFVCGSPSSVFEIRAIYRTRRRPAPAPEPEGGSENRP